jgi:prephenate dehydratase
MLKVLIQGEKGSNHHIVVNNLFSELETEIISAQTFAELAERLEAREADIAVMAIENSIAGSLLDNFDLLSNNKFSVVGEFYLRISHYLIGSPGSKLEDIVRVYSQPIAIKQCERFISENELEGAEYFDTAAAVPYVLKLNEEAGIKAAAAIAPKLAAEIYDAEVIKAEIETDKDNYTRFVILSRQNEPVNNEVGKAIAEKSNGLQKVMLEMVLKHETGSLVKALSTLANEGFNLTKIESRPIIGESWNYRFYIDFVTDLEKRSIEDKLQHLKGLVNYLRILGTFNAGKKFQP